MRTSIKKSRMARKLTRKFDDELRFFKTWMGSPKTTGSILPTGPHLAKSMASIVRADSGLPVLELGPGTGVITRAILNRGIAPDKLYSLEYEEDFIGKLRASFPGVNFIQGDAFDLDAVLSEIEVDKFDSVVSSLPLLNFPRSKRDKLINQLLDLVPPGRPVVQYSYGAKSPISTNRQNYTIERHDWIMRNVPPARVWLYRRPDCFNAET